MQPPRLHAASQIASSQPDAWSENCPETCLSGAGTQNLPGCCSCWLRIQHLHFEQLKAEHLSFPTRPQAPAESNSKMKSTVQLDSCLKNGWTALYYKGVANSFSCTAIVRSHRTGQGEDIWEQSSNIGAVRKEGRRRKRKDRGKPYNLHTDHGESYIRLVFAWVKSYRHHLLRGQSYGILTGLELVLS